MKKIFSLILLVTLSIVLSSCLDAIIGDEKFDEKRTEDFSYQLAYNSKTDEWDIYAIGDIFSEKEAVFIPPMIDGLPIRELGYSRGVTDVGLRTYCCGRLYLPNTIKSWGSNYAITTGVKLFFCGNPNNLNFFFDGLERSNNHIYVPYDEYQLFYEVNGEIIEKANVSYYLNYPDGNYKYNKYYYIDFYEDGELIQYIPPIPEKEGYIFAGWYKEAECINEWNFEKDTIKYSKYRPVTYLYAKWILN